MTAAASATADGSGGSAVKIGGSDATATSSPTVATYVGTFADITAGGDIAITSTSVANTSSNGTNQGDGFVAVGSGRPRMSRSSTTTAQQSTPGPSSPRRATSH